MSKKRQTKKQKIIADLRRKLALKEDIIPQEQLSLSPTPPNKATTVTTRISPSTGLATHKQNDYSYVTRDLLRSGGFAGLAILLQLVLYWALR